MVYPNLFELIKLIIYCHWNQFQKFTLPTIGSIGKGDYYFIGINRLAYSMQLQSNCQYWNLINTIIGSEKLFAQIILIPLLADLKYPMIQQWDQLELIASNTLIYLRAPIKFASFGVLISKSLSLSANNCIFNMGLR